MLKLLISVILTGILYSIFFSGSLPKSLLGYVSGNQLLSYNPVCDSMYFCRSLGYPFLQNIFLFFQADESIFIFSQVLLFSFSCIFLASEFYKVTNQKILSYLLFFSIYLNPKTFKYGFTISEESVFIPLIAIVSALIIKFSRNRDITTLLTVSFAVGISITVRSAGYAMLPLLFIILVIYWRQFGNARVKAVLFSFLPAILLITGESYLYYANNTHDRETTQGVVLLGKVPLIAVNKPKDSQYPNLSNIAYQRGELVRNTIDSIDNFSLQQYLRNVFNPVYNDLKGLYQPMSKQITHYKKQFGSRDKVTSGLFKEYAKENPLTTLKIIALNYVGLWQLSEILTSEQSTELSQWLREQPIIDSYHKDRVLYHFDVIKNHIFFAKTAKVFFLILLLATYYLFIEGSLKLLKNYKDQVKINALYFNVFIFPVMLNGYFILLAIMINVQMRFILTYWSVLMVILFFTLHILFCIIRRTNIKI